MIKKISTSSQLLKRSNTPHNQGVFKVPLKRQTLHLGSNTKIMGILNVTPDSFTNDGILNKSKNLLAYAIEKSLSIEKDGADILDIGGESSRPGAKKISIKEEITRVVPIIKTLSKKIKIPISVDTYKPQVAEEALKNGATIVNNIMGTPLDKKLLKIVKKYKAAIVLMHIKGTPQTMQKNIFYNNLILDIIFALEKSIEECLEIGIDSDKIIIDPGIGFGKTAQDNLKIINQLDQFKRLGYPILIGTSRKSFIGKILNKETPDRLLGTQATTAISIYKGANIIRVHDVKEAKEIALITDSIIDEGRNIQS